MEDQGKNQISAIKESEKQIIKSNEIAKNDFNIDPNNIVYVYSTDKKNPKDFGNY